MNTIDFTPQWYRVQLQSRGNRRKRLGFVGAIFLLMVCWFVLNEGRIQRANADLRDTQASHEQSLQLSSRLQSLKEERARLQQQKDRYEGLLKNLPPSVVFAEISHRLPEGAILVEFQLRPIDGRSALTPRTKTRPGVAAPTAPSKTEYCDFIATLTAQTPDGEDMFTLVQNLSESPLFRDLDPEGTVNRQIGDTTVKEKKMDLYVLSVECIGP